MWKVASHLIDFRDAGSGYATHILHPTIDITICSRGDALSVRRTVDERHGHNVAISCPVCASHICINCGSLLHQHAQKKCLFQPTEFANDERLDCNKAVLSSL
jgi:hypothetical protein